VAKKLPPLTKWKEERAAKVAESRKLQQEYTALKNEIREVEIIRKAAEKIPEKHFSELLAGYDAEQAALDAEIAERQAAIDTYHADSVRADKFIELAKKYTGFTEFSAALLNQFVEKVVVHEAEKADGKRTQQIDIHLSFIGKVAIPELEEPQEDAPVRKSKKKPRRDMTEEEVARLRERDRIRYAAKVAAKKAAEEAERASILQGTAYEKLLAEKEAQQIAS
jgi:hypothetical protein